MDFLKHSWFRVNGLRRVIPGALAFCVWFACDTAAHAAVILLDTGTTSSAAIGGALTSAGIKVQHRTPEEMAHAAQDTSVSVWITPHIGKCRSDVMGAITAHLESGGRLLVLGEPAFQEITYPVNGRWVSKDEYLVETFPAQPAVKMDEQTVRSLQVNSDNRDPGNSVTLTTQASGAPQRFATATIPRLKGWTTFATTATAPMPAGAVTTFWARGTKHTTQLALEWTEQDGSRWIATINLRPEWHYYALAPGAFEFYTDPMSAGRGGARDVLQTEHARMFSVGLAQTHTKLDEGPHEFGLGDVGFAAAAPNEAANGEPPYIDGISPMEMLYPMAPKSATVSECFSGNESSELPLPASAWSSIWRPMGSGIGKNRSQRFIPVVTASNADDSRAGTLAAMFLNFEKPYPNAVYGYVSVTEDEILLSPKWLSIIADMTRRMETPTFLREAGSSKFTYDVRDLADGKFEIGARPFDTSDTLSGSEPYVTTVRVSSADKTVSEKQGAGMRPAAVAFLQSYDPATSRNLHMRAGLRQGGKLLDAIEQDIGFDGPRPAANSFVSVRDRQFWKDGRHWRAFGVNYMPSSGVARKTSRDFEYWMEDPAYDPAIVEADLSRIEGLGINCISAFIYEQSIGNGNLLDLLRRARAHGLLVNLSLRPNKAPWAASDHVLKSLIESFRMSEKDEIMAYDIAWEPWWGDQAKRKAHVPAWREWLTKRYGSIEQAQSAWGPEPGSTLEAFPTDEQLRTDGPSTKAVADYRTFVDEAVHESYSHARATIRGLDPNHLVSFRESEGANPFVDPAAFPIEMRSVSDAVDFFSPEAYGVGDTAEKAATMKFAASYAQGLAPGKPILCAEYGQSVWNGRPFEPDALLYQRQAQVFRNVLECAQDARFAGTIAWWFAGGYRVNENSDYGIVNPDNTARPVEAILCKYAQVEKAPFAPVEWKPNITAKREESVRGYVGIYERTHSHFENEQSSTSLPLLQTIANKPTDTSITVAAYYYPCTHPDPRWDKAKYPGFTEWDLVRKAKPRFPGHKQPKVPVWGYTDESDPQVMEQKIAAAADYGVDAFIFDWYFYNDGPYLEGALDNGFLHAANNSRIKFALMWANHDWFDIQGYNPANPVKLLYPGKVTPETWDKITDLVISRYFKHPSYWKIDGKPYFSIYEMSLFLESFGSVEAARAALDRFREKSRAAGFPGLHINAILWGTPNLPGGKTPADWPGLCRNLALDSVTGYTWVHHGALNYSTFPISDYVTGRNVYLNFWQKALTELPVPYFPNATINWDNSPRAHPDAKWDHPAAHVVNPVMTGNTPAAFQAACQLIKDRLLAAPTQPKVITINAWNEWPEGSMLEPEKEYGFGYLEAIKNVFRPRDR